MRAYAIVLASAAIVSIAACGSESIPPPRDAAPDARTGDTGAADSGARNDTAAPTADAAPAVSDAPAARDAPAASLDAAAGSAAADGAAAKDFSDAVIPPASADATADAAIDPAAAVPVAGLDAAAADTAAAPDPLADAGPTPSFMVLDPCLTENSYVTGPATVSFRVTTDKPGYAPPCLKVRRGSEVMFTAISESFAVHPLEPRMEGSPDNPITLTTVGTSATFSLPTPGFFPYHCMIHPTAMVGVIWVTE
jgi:plastocyanin